VSVSFRNIVMMDYRESELGDIEESLQSLLRESQKKIKEMNKREKENSTKTTQFIIDRARAESKDRTKQRNVEMSSSSVSRVKTEAVAKARPSTNTGIKGSVLTSTTTPSSKVKFEKEREDDSSESPDRKTRDERSEWVKTAKPTILSNTKNGTKSPNVGYAKKTQPKLEHQEDDEDVSVDTVKINAKSAKTSAKKKKKIKHKITTHILHDIPETSLMKHFFEAGEWKKVLRPEMAEFTYVCNEKRLDWEISLKTMVNPFLILGQ
jgi:hypothetical protein